MAPRANWKGHLKLPLVSYAVALYPATLTSQRIHFDIINRKTDNRIRNDIVDAETGQPVVSGERPSNVINLIDALRRARARADASARARAAR